MDRRSRIRGSLIGGAAGDALGYAVEFLSYKDIQHHFGATGIQKYSIDSTTKKAVISDDTQMTLFTACGILVGATRYVDRGIGGFPSTYMSYMYLDWLYTQGFAEKDYTPRAWITSIPELNHQRAPGRTCLLALGKREFGTRENPINGSKGCGGIMRVAPMGLFYTTNTWEMPKYDTLLEETAAIVEITHGHPLGYLPAATVVHIIHEIMHDTVSTRKDLISVARQAVSECRRVFADEDMQFLDELDRINELAITLANNSDDDLSNIEKLGEGWVAEETYGIALYCCIRHFGDFSSTIRSAVNHNGDSDSTGAVAGNIMGAIVGYDAIDDIWKEKLELRDIIIEIADDLTDGPTGEDYYTISNSWEDKYLYGINPHNS